MPVRTMDMRRAVWLPFVAILGASIWGSDTAHADMIDTTGMEPWETCALCHGLDGISRMGRFPKLAGQDAAYIEKQLRDFREGTRTNDGGRMSAIASGELEEKNIAVVAKYFASQKPPEPAALPEGKDFSLVAILFSQGDADRGISPCSSCHLTTSVGPRITSQHADYIAKQLLDFKNSERQNDDAEVMRSIAKKLSDQEIVDLADYVASKPRATQKQD